MRTLPPPIWFVLQGDSVGERTPVRINRTKSWFGGKTTESCDTGPTSTQWREKGKNHPSTLNPPHSYHHAIHHFGLPHRIKIMPCTSDTIPLWMYPFLCNRKPRTSTLTSSNDKIPLFQCYSVATGVFKPNPLTWPVDPLTQSHNGDSIEIWKIFIF